MSETGKRAAAMAAAERWLSAFLRALPAGFKSNRQQDPAEMWIRTLEQSEWRPGDNQESFLRRVTARALAGLANRRPESAEAV